jgi:hypothetical protein
MKLFSSPTLVSVAILAASAAAQTGTLDQSNPYPPLPPIQTAGFNGSAPSLEWQQQVRTGMSGQLEGFNLYLNGAVGSTMNVRVRVGDAWNTSAIVFQTLLAKPTANSVDVVFVDCSASNIQVASGATFVIEIQGDNSNGGFLGSYAPAPNTPSYPEELFLGPNATTCFSDCRWRMSFDTFMLTATPPVSYCTSGTTTNGCNAQIAASAQPSASFASPCTITVSDVEGQRTGIVFYGLQALPQQWCGVGVGTSFLCVKPPTQRSFPQNSNGANNSCGGQLTLDWNSFQQAFPGSLGAPWSSGDKAYVQAWFRDPASCRTTSLSNGLELTYKP